MTIELWAARNADTRGWGDQTRLFKTEPELNPAGVWRARSDDFGSLSPVDLGLEPGTKTKITITTEAAG